jgi:hypothetical protein
MNSATKTYYQIKKLTLAINVKNHPLNQILRISNIQNLLEK